MKKKNTKEKRVKAWIVVSIHGSIYTYKLRRKYNQGAQEETHWTFTSRKSAERWRKQWHNCDDFISLPCEISYTLPKKKLSAKRKEK